MSPVNYDQKVLVVDEAGLADETVFVVNGLVVDLTGASDGDVLTIQPDGSIAAEQPDGGVTSANPAVTLVPTGLNYTTLDLTTAVSNRALVEAQIAALGPTAARTVHVTFAVGTGHLALAPKAATSSGSGVVYEIPAGLTIHLFAAASAGGALFDFAGTAPAGGTALAAQANPGDTSLTLASAVTIPAGSWCQLRSEATLVTEAGTIVKKGEAVRVLTAVVASVTVPLEQAVEDTYAVADTAKLIVAAPAVNCGVVNNGLIKPGDATATHTRGIRMTDVEAPTLAGTMKFQGLNNTAVELARVHDFEIPHNWARDLVNDPAGGSNGYGLAVGGTSRAGRIGSVVGHNLRHAFTTTVAGYGQPIGIHVASLKASVVNDSANHATSLLDTHGIGRDISFGVVDLSNAGPACIAVQMRAGMEIGWLKVRNCARGLLTGVTNYDGPNIAKVHKATFKNITGTGSSGGQAMRFDKGSRIEIGDAEVDGCNRHALAVLGTHDRISIGTLRVKDAMKVPNGGEARSAVTVGANAAVTRLDIGTLDVKNTPAGLEQTGGGLATHALEVAAGATITAGRVWNETDEGLVTAKWLISANTGLKFGNARELIVKTGDQVLTQSNTTPQDVTDLAFPLAAREQVLVDAEITYDGSTVADIKFDWAIPAGATVVATFTGLSAGATGATGSINAGVVVASGSTAGLGGAGVGTPVAVRGWALIRNGATAGTVQLQAAQSTSEATNVTVKADSLLLVRPGFIA